MAKTAQSLRQTARVIPLRKGTTIEMTRLACPDQQQALLISESFGLPVLDGDGIRDMHERLIVETAASLQDGLGERAMQIHLQRIVGAYVGSAHGAGQFYSRAVTDRRRHPTWRRPRLLLPRDGSHPDAAFRDVSRWGFLCRDAEP
jgi:hypothetical protein